MVVWKTCRAYGLKYDLGVCTGVIIEMGHGVWMGVCVGVDSRDEGRNSLMLQEGLGSRAWKLVVPCLAMCLTRSFRSAGR